MRAGRLGRGLPGPPTDWRSEGRGSRVEGASRCGFCRLYHQRGLCSLNSRPSVTCSGTPSHPPSLWDLSTPCILSNDHWLLGHGVFALYAWVRTHEVNGTRGFPSCAATMRASRRCERRTPSTRNASPSFTSCARVASQVRRCSTYFEAVLEMTLKSNAGWLPKNSVRSLR